MFNWWRWVGMNIFLPLTPLFLRVYITFLGKNKINVLEAPELLFFAIFTCITALNINADGKKSGFESFLRVFLIIIAVLDLITFAMIYSNNAGKGCTAFSIVSAVITMIIAPAYKLYDMKQKEELEK